MKYTMYFAGLIACFFSIVAAQAQESKFLESPARKLQLAEFAIANLYVDEVNEGKLVGRSYRKNAGAALILILPILIRRK